MATTYDELVRLCTNGSTEPYDYQRRIAAEGLPELLNIPTGAGKTMAVVLGWLYRRRFHPDLAVRAATPHWLVICQPMRTLVEQVRKNAETWLNAAGLADDVDPVNLFVFMGGEPTAENDWRLQVHQDAIIVGTQDMLLSRALNRGFGSSRFLWPVEFGVLNTGCHWVFDEVQLMGAGVPTGRQLAAFRAAFPALLPQGSTWMSATVDRGALATIDNPTIVTDFGLSEADRTGPLRKRLTAPKLVSEIALAVDAKRGRQLAARVVEEHRPGTLTLAIVNTVADAQAVHEAVVKAAPVAEVILLHSRFRRGDRARLVERLIAPIGADSPGRICISTQVIEAGMDLDAAIVFTEAAPWSSIVQRFGRCNRAGTTDDAKALWFAPAKPDKPRPYEAEDVAEATDALRSLEGQTVQADGLAEQGPAPRRPLHSVLRRRDLDNLFDTMPDISGADVDVTPFVRDLDDDRSVHIAWRDLGTDLSGERAPNQAELCPAPLSKALSEWAKNNRVFRFDFLERKWQPATDIRPNQLLLADLKAGGYTVERGWDPSVRTAVPEPVDPDRDSIDAAEQLETTEDDSASIGQPVWVTLSTHLLDAERHARLVAEGFGIRNDLVELVATAARLHDIGKAHPAFQDTMRRGAEASHWNEFDDHAPMAKSRGRHKHKTKHFRHELASALALLGEARPALNGLPAHQRMLCVYLVAAHHGRIRASLRSMPGEGPNVVFGVQDGDELPSVRIGDLQLPHAGLRPTALTGLGIDADGSTPWHEHANALLDELGPFTLAFLEALVRVADWRASNDPTDEGFPR